MFSTLKEAEAVVGGLSKPSKMPGLAFGLPAKRCITGSKLAKTPGSVCSKCYALKGRYMFANVQEAQERRFQLLSHPRWVEAMTFLINKKCTKSPFFRWHDSGDIQSQAHLRAIVQVARNCPTVSFWMPTRENAMVAQYLRTHGDFPSNLVVRVSGAMIDGPAPVRFINTSTVTSNGEHTCPAYKQDGKCGSCRACWDPRVTNVAYPKH